MSRYVVSLRPTGLGDRLICLCAAWIFARNTGRTLVVDWRGSRYTPRPEENLFSLCFANSIELAGVPLRVAAAGMEDLPAPAFPDHWNSDDLLAEPWRGPKEDSEAIRDHAVTVIRSQSDIDAPTVIFNTCVNDGVTDFAEARRFYRALHSLPHIQAAVEEYHRSTMAGGPLIGLHVRHGNGGNILGHARHWTSFDEGIGRCLRAVAFARSRTGPDAPVFLCTDSSEVVAAITSAIPNVRVRNKILRYPGEGELHHDPVAHQGREDALAEMLLLARCDVLIRYPPASFFSIAAAVLKPSVEPPPDRTYDLAIPFEREDPLTCAVLF
jgi:hypothetical protein